MIAELIDHTLLKPDATHTDIVRICAEAREYGFASVCVNPYWAGLVATELQGSDVKTCTVVGFPLGATSGFVKSTEASEAMTAGAREVDMVINISALKSGDAGTVSEEIQFLAETCHVQKAILKVIIETALLTDEQKQLACRLAADAGADFVKTSTGFAAKGATVEDVTLMRSVVGPKIGVKASGGIRTLADVEKMVAAGANRIGASAGVSIMQEFLKKAPAAPKSVTDESY